jgi:hypothetical protein
MHVHQLSRPTSTDVLVEPTTQLDTAPDLTPAKFICPECQDVFTEQVWHS